MERDVRSAEKGASRVDNDVKVPWWVRWEIKDLVDPIVLRRRWIWFSMLTVSVLIGAAFLGWVLFSQGPSGEALLQEMVQAAGGMEQWKAVEEGTFTRVHQQYDANGNVERTVEQKFYFKEGKEGAQLAVETTGKQGRIVIGRGADGYWATQDGTPVQPLTVAQSMGFMCESEQCTPLCGAEMAMYRFAMPFKLTDPGVNSRNIGTAMLNGVPVYLLEVTYDPEIGSDRWLFYVDQKSKLIQKVEHFGSTTSSSPPEEIYWTDYQTKQGLTFSHRRSYYRNNGTKLEEYLIKDVDFQSPVAAERFVRPAGLTTSENG